MGTLKLTILQLTYSAHTLLLALENGVEVVAVPTTSTIHEYVTLLFVQVVVIPWDVSLAPSTLRLQVAHS